MENSFFEYRDKTGASSDSDSEVIDNSLVIQEPFSAKKKLPGSAFKNPTVFVAESEESTTSGSEEEPDEEVQLLPKSRIRRRNVPNPHVVFSSDDDGSREGSIRGQSESSPHKVDLSSSDEEAVSPELVPRRRPPTRPKSTDSHADSFIGRLKSKKRMILMDSDTDNSILIEHDKNRKLVCLKDTPLKIDSGKKPLPSDVKLNMSAVDNDSDDEESEEEEGSDESDEEVGESDDDGPDEDQMVMSRATRMSIMGVIPKDADSDESDFIQSDESKPNSRVGSTCSLSELPDVSVSLNKSSHAPRAPNDDPVIVEVEPDKDTSRITCSPFASPLKDITNEPNESIDKNKTLEISNQNTSIIDLDLKENESQSLRSKVLNNLVNEVKPASLGSYGSYGNVEDDDEVTIIDSKPEIIALSSDDEDEVKEVKKSPNTKKSPKVKDEDSSGPKRGKENSMQQYLAPPSQPGQVVYVQKHVRENELTKLHGLQEDLHNIRNLLENMDVSTLPDGGVRLTDRLTALEAEVRRQGDKVANMVVEPNVPTPDDIAKDGFDKQGLSWDDIQKASIAVQPRMFGKQAMSTHMAERNLILERLRNLHESFASRPPESAAAPAPRQLSSALMPHQLHALAWLRWRETQRPCGGILADDMGLGKTITMISLILSDMEGNIDDDDDDDDDDEYSKGSSKLTRGNTLVVCPASLMQQWAGEVNKHCAAHSLNVCLHHGAARAETPHRLAPPHLVLTTYNILQRDSEKNGVLMRMRWRRIILDEAHIVRNHKSATSLAVSALHARRRWCLTGTPVQNKDLDLFALMKFLRVTPFDDLTMWKKWIDNKSQGGQERLSTIMRCVLLRRTKQQLQESGQLTCLPARTLHQQHVALTKQEMNVYQKVLVFSKTLFAQFLHQRAEKNADAQGFMSADKDTAYSKMHKKMIALQGAKPVKSHEILVLLLRLRQVCCHCGLIAAMLDADDAGAVQEDAGGADLLAELNKLSLEDSKRKSGGKEEEEEEGPEQEGTSVAEAIRSVLSPNNPVFDLQRLSSKITAVMECLQENVFKNKGEKAVVVSQWTSVLRLVEQELSRARVKSVTLSGSVAVSARAPLIAALNDPGDPVKVMLLSLCAGGVGLNLCGANHLLLLDPHWNPQLEQQAQDRIYRVGQEKHVHIYRFMCVDTVEQSIRKLQEDKLELAESVLTGARHTNSKLSIDDLKLLFNMGQ